MRSSTPTSLICNVRTMWIALVVLLAFTGYFFFSLRRQQLWIAGYQFNISSMGADFFNNQDVLVEKLNRLEDSLDWFRQQQQQHQQQQQQHQQPQQQQQQQQQPQQSTLVSLMLEQLPLQLKQKLGNDDKLVGEVLASIITRPPSSQWQTRYSQLRREHEAFLNANAKQVPKSEGHSGQMTFQTNCYHRLLQLKSFHTLCETGFNLGHSSLTHLTSNPNLKLYEFDIGGFDFVDLAAQNLHKIFGDRLTLTLGDSHVTIKEFHKQHPQLTCDLTIVDGDHREAGAHADLEDFYAMVDLDKNPLSLVVMDDYGCNAHWCVGPTAAWDKWETAGRIGTLFKWLHESGDRGFVMGIWKR